MISYIVYVLLHCSIFRLHERLFCCLVTPSSFTVSISFIKFSYARALGFDRFSLSKFLSYTFHIYATVIYIYICVYVTLTS